MTHVTIVGAGTSAPQPDTPASGILVETDSAALLVDCGQGVIRDVMKRRDPRELDAIVIGHMHADHYIDLVSLRYLMPWTGYTGRRVPILLPPGGRARMDLLAEAISEREGFFDHTFDVTEYDPSATIRFGDLSLGFIAGGHYVPAWGCTIDDGHGRRVVISGDTGPNEELVEIARGADLVIVEATLLEGAEDDPKRGHLTADEALDIGARAEAGLTVLVHHRPQNREAIIAACADRANAVVGLPGLTIDLTPVDAGGGASTDGQLETGPAGIASSAARARPR